MAWCARDRSALKLQRVLSRLQGSYYEPCKDVLVHLDAERASQKTVEAICSILRLTLKLEGADKLYALCNARPRAGLQLHAYYKR